MPFGDVIFVGTNLIFLALIQKRSRMDRTGVYYGQSMAVAGACFIREGDDVADGRGNGLAVLGDRIPSVSRQLLVILSKVSSRRIAFMFVYKPSPKVKS